LAEVRIGMLTAERVSHLVTPDARKMGVITFLLVYDHLVPKYAELPAAARDIIGIKEVVAHLPTLVLWRS
jgi:hypothetical protein